MELLSSKNWISIDTDLDVESHEDTRTEIDKFFESTEIPKISISETPKTQSWAFEPLYKDDINGKMRLWQVGYNHKTQSLVSRHGHVESCKYTPEQVLVTTNKSGRPLHEQAILQARRMFNDKYEKDLYRPAGMSRGAIVEPALANLYEPGKVKNWPVAAQAKLDGFRIRCSEESGRLVFRSKTHREYSNLEHIHIQIQDFIKYMPAGCILDGELYIHGIEFEDLTTIIKPEQPHERVTDLEFYIFDCYLPEDIEYESRYMMMVNAYAAYLRDGKTNTAFHLLASTMCHSEEEMWEYHDYCVSEGYEGAIIRNVYYPHLTPEAFKKSLYKPTRSNNMLKVKVFTDDEGIIVGVMQSRGKEKGCILFKLEKNGKTFGVRPIGTHEHRRELYKRDHAEFLGRIYKYKYFRLTKDGVPRFPIGLGFRDYLE